MYSSFGMNLKVSTDENAQSKKLEAKPLQLKSFSIFEDKTLNKKKPTNTRIGASSSVSLNTVKEEQVEKKENVAKLRLAESKKIQAEEEEVSQDTAISTDISNLHIPDSNDDSESIFKFDLDMSIDSLCCSPMSVDKTVVARRTEHQLTFDNFLNVDEYEAEIYKYIKESETRYRPKPGYMRKQPDITYSMRSILVDWLVEVADEYNLQPETLFLAVSYIDRFLSYMSVVRGKLQLVGTAAMFIASKFEEIYPPDVGEFVYITDDTYTKKQVLRMEHLILKVLAFDMSAPTILRFAIKYCLVSNSSEPVRHLAQYLCELSLLDAEHFLHFLPSELGAASTALARHTLDLDPWPESLQKLTGLRIEQLYVPLRALTHAFNGAATYPQKAVHEKFSSSKWNAVAQLKPLIPGLVPDLLMEDAALQDELKKQECSVSSSITAAPQKSFPSKTASK
ncbi:hypothetical protein B566_EDAN009524 [Ephemera danica]|nr:hypothetical protein B566_EDAN009524 [Ephemera danica]